MSAINLTKGGFLRRVSDIENNPDNWKFLGDKPALIDFYASWCNPCQRLLPIIDEIAAEYEGRIDVYKVNVDDEQSLSSYFGIRSIPTLLYVPMSEAPIKIPGAPSKAQLKENIEQFLLK